MQIKICGLTDVSEAEYLNRNHVDYAGFVLFYEKSKRNLTIEEAKPIMAALDKRIKKVAVTVEPTVQQVREAYEAGFDLIQIHGKLQSGALDVGLPVLKAFNITDMDNYEYYQSCPQIVGYVFDAHEPGSGKAFDWNLLQTLPRDDKLFLLAGGLHAGNVAQAIACVRPDGVDVSSGVEYADRKGKNPAKIDAFVKAARDGSELSLA